MKANQTKWVHNPTNPCSCSLRSPNAGVFTIEYCPVHEAAGKLLAALQMFVAQYQGNGQDEREQRPEMIAARAALKEAGL